MGAGTYLDHAASSPMRPEAVTAMLPYLTEHAANPTGAHRAARRARAALDDAREAIAAVLGVDLGEVVFTGGGTEADNLAISGVLARAGGLAVCPAAEHHAVLHPVAHHGGAVVRVDATAVVDLDALADALGPEVRLVSVMAVNNEVGSVTPMALVAAVVRERAPRAFLHTDAVQAAPWLDLARDVVPHVDLLSLSAHKFGGPKGFGVLVHRAGVPLAPMLLGGGQERDRRSGTPDVAGAVATAAALTATVAERPEETTRIAALRDRLVDGLVAAVDGLAETVPRAVKVAGNAHLTVEGVESESLLFLLDQVGVYAAAGSSCASGAVQVSHVLAAMGVERSRALGSLRLSLGRTTTDADVDRVLEVLPDAVARLRRSPATIG